MGWNGEGRSGNRRWRSKMGRGSSAGGGHRRRKQRCVRGVRWRARRAALMAVRAQRGGLVASVARGNEGRPQSAARQGTAGLFGRHGGIAARRRTRVASCSSTAGLTGWGRGRSASVRGVRTRAGRESAARGQAAGSERGQAAAQRGSEAAAAAQRGSERTRAQVPARARRAEREGQRGREREERGREWREKEIVNALT